MVEPPARSEAIWHLSDGTGANFVGAYTDGVFDGNDKDFSRPYSASASECLDERDEALDVLFLDDDFDLDFRQKTRRFLGLLVCQEPPGTAEPAAFSYAHAVSPSLYECEFQFVELERLYEALYFSEHSSTSCAKTRFVMTPRGQRRPSTIVHIGFIALGRRRKVAGSRWAARGYPASPSHPLGPELLASIPLFSKQAWGMIGSRVNEVKKQSDDRETVVCRRARLRATLLRLVCLEVLLKTDVSGYETFNLHADLTNGPDFRAPGVPNWAVKFTTLFT